ncbi:MAG: hypothetical protein IPM98_10260 [Lewinellaceae bacterium]|nr:hypothetical protein [Lewinellaceae bacterium]
MEQRGGAQTTAQQLWRCRCMDDQARLFQRANPSTCSTKHTGDKIRTVGAKWSSFQINNFQRNSQPWYVLMHNDGKTLLNQPRGYTPDVAEYRAFLECGVDAFAELKSKEEGKSLIGAN